MLEGGSHADRRLGRTGHRRQPRHRQGHQRGAARPRRGEGLRGGARPHDGHATRASSRCGSTSPTPAQVAAVAAALGDVEIVVNNAGIGRAATPLAADLDDARAELEVELPGVARRPRRSPRPRRERRRRVRQRAVRGVLDRRARPRDLLGVEVGGVELHELRPRRAQAAGHPGRRRARRLRRHRPHRGARHRQDPARRGRRRRRSTRWSAGTPRRSSTSSAAR